MSFLQSLQRAKEKIEAKMEEQRPRLEQRLSSSQLRRPPPVPPRPPAIPPRPPGYELAAPALPPRLPSSSRQFANAVYYPSWSVYKGKTPASLNVASITHVFYAFMGVNEDGTLRHFDEWADINKEADGAKGCLAALAKLKHEHPHLKTIVSFGGGSGSKEFPALAASEHARRKFADEARKFCQTHSLDGVDIDWEHPSNDQQGQNYLKLLQACRDALPHASLLTTALPVGQYILKHIDLRAVSCLVDHLNLMSYDFAGSWTKACGNHAQLHQPARDLTRAHPELANCSSAGVDYILSRGFPSGKLLFGIPAYARFFPRANAHGQAFQDAGEMDYCEMPDEWVERAQVDERAVAAWHVDDGGRGFVSFDVPWTVRAKARYAAEKGLGGLFYWTGTGDKEGCLGLVAAGKQALG